MPDSTQRALTQVEVRREGHVATITFATESGINILSSPVLGTLKTHIERLAEDAAVRFVVFRGAGKTFAAGADIAQMSTFDADQGMAYSKNGHHVFDAIEAMPQVTFAAITGHALGGGCELALACDFRLATANAKLGQPESRLGLIPGWGGTKRLTKLVGMAQARRLMFTGEQIAAERARGMGLVDEVFSSADELDAGLNRWIDALLAGSPAAIRRIKHALQYNDEPQQFSQCFSCSDAKEGMRAFLDKRAPSWTGDPA